MIPPPAAWQPPALGTGERIGSRDAQDGAGGGASFGDLLAAMLSAQVPPPGFLGAVPEARAEIAAAKLETAQVFNERGFLEGPVEAISAQATGSAARERSAAAHALHRLHRQTDGLPVAVAAAAGAASVLPAEARPAPVPTATVPIAQSGAAGAAVRATGPTATIVPHGAVLQPEPGPEAEREAVENSDLAESPERLLEEMEDYLRGGSALDAQLSLEAGEEGLRLLARIGRLAREERERLRGDMARLLASHGYSAAEIRLNGEAGAPRRA